MDARSLRLQERFKTIQQALEETSNRDIAYATASVAWLEVIEWWGLQAMRKLEGHINYSDPEELLMVPVLHRELKHLLQSFHEDLCKHLKLDQADIINRSSAFKEIVDDICHERG